MTNKSTKRALLSSAIALCLCFVMLVGTTFAWFTDEVTSSGNVIKTGKLDVQLFKHDAAGRTEITDSSDPIFGKSDSANANENTADTLWEPGKTQTVYLSIKNNGSLDLKYKVAIEVTNITKGLNEVLTYVITPDKQYEELTKADLPADWSLCSKVVSGINIATEDVKLLNGQEHFFALSVHMDELAGNEYQDADITFNIKVLAGQLASEEDSFDNQYDINAEYPDYNYYEIPTDPTAFDPAGFEIEIKNEKTKEKVGTMTFPATSLAEDATHVGGRIVETESYEGGNIQITNGYTARYYQVTASGLKSDNDVPVKVKIFIAEGLDPATFAVYHYEEALGVNDFSYNPETGYVTFSSATFSPFAIIYDADSEYVAPEIPVDPETPNTPKLPVAKVTKSPEYENVDLPWGSFGSWSPTAGLDNHLEGAFTFSVTETLDEAKANAFANWNCDFFVKLDRDLAANQIFLGGNYGSFGWVGFHNGDLTLEANNELPLLGSVTSNPWSYVDVVQNVGTFICGVGDVNNALEGATFTVSLRLTNPDDETEFYNVAVVEHKFGGVTNNVEAADDAALDSALAGATNDVKVTVADGTYTLPGNIASENVTIVGNGANTVFDFTQVNSANGANITFENLYFQGKNENVMNGFGIQNTTGTIIYRNCTFDGAVTNEYYGNVIYIDCTFTGTGYITTYAVKSAKFVNCTFDKADSRAVLVYSHGDIPCEVTLENCTFKADDKATTWNGDWTAAIEIDTTNIPTAGTSVTIKGCEFDANYSGLYRDKSAAGKANAVITVVQD